MSANTNNKTAASPASASKKTATQAVVTEAKQEQATKPSNFQIALGWEKTSLKGKLFCIEAKKADKSGAPIGKAELIAFSESLTGALCTRQNFAVCYKLSLKGRSFTGTKLDTETKADKPYKLVSEKGEALFLFVTHREKTDKELALFIESGAKACDRTQNTAEPAFALWERAQALKAKAQAQASAEPKPKATAKAPKATATATAEQLEAVAEENTAASLSEGEASLESPSA